MDIRAQEDLALKEARAMRSLLSINPRSASVDVLYRLGTLTCCSDRRYLN